MITVACPRPQTPRYCTNAPSWVKPPQVGNTPEPWEYAAYQESGGKHVPSIVKMCLWMEVSRSGFYDWRNAPESATVKRRGILALYVKKSFDDSDGTYGYRRVHTDLAAWGVPGRAGAGAVGHA